MTKQDDGNEIIAPTGSTTVGSATTEEAKATDERRGKKPDGCSHRSSHAKRERGRYNRSKNCRF